MEKIILILVTVFLVNIFSLKAQLNNEDALIASTFLSGNSDIYAMTIDNNGDIIVVGHTESSDFPTTSGVISTTLSDVDGDIFISKFNADLTQLLASTYLGGTLSDYAYAIKIDTDNNIYVTGRTRSTDFPTTTGAYDETSNGNDDAFVAKINSDLTALIASTYLGGNNTEQSFDIEIMSDGKIIIAGYATGTNVPTTENAYDGTYNGGYSDSFISIFSNNLETLHASTYLGGSNSENFESLEIDNNGNVVVVGYTVSQDFPTTQGVIQEVKVHDTDYEGFICSFSPDLQTLQTSTFLGTEGASDGSTGSDQIASVVIDNSNNIIVVGRTNSDAFPATTGAYDETHNGDDDLFITKINNSMTSIIASTYFGGATYFEYPEQITIDKDENIVVSGQTGSTDFPTTSNAFDTTFNYGYSDIFVSKFNSDLTEVLLSTFIGGDGSEGCEALCTDSDGEIFISGYTGSFEFPVTSGAYSTTWAYDVCFVSKLQGNPAVSSLQNIKNEELKIYPNPTNDFITISENVNIKNIQILGIDGRIYKTINNSTKFDVNGLNSGVYFLKFELNNQIKNIKFIKE